MNWTPRQPDVAEGIGMGQRQLRGNEEGGGNDGKKNVMVADTAALKSAGWRAMELNDK